MAKFSTFCRFWVIAIVLITLIIVADAKVRHHLPPVKEGELRPPCRKAPTFETLGAVQGGSPVAVLYGGKGFEWIPKVGKGGRTKRKASEEAHRFKKQVEFFGDTWLFEFQSQTWNRLDITGPVDRWKQEATHIDGLPGPGRLAVFGGCTTTTSDGVQNDLWVFKLSQDGSAGAWTQIKTENPPLQRRGHTVIANDTHLFIVGGKTSPNLTTAPDHCLVDTWALPLKALEPSSSDTTYGWTRGADFPGGCRWGTTGTKIRGPDGKDFLAIFGGRHLNDESLHHTAAKGAYTYYNELWLYDFSADQWSLVDPVGEAPQRRDHHGATRIGDDLYVFAGRIAEEFTADANKNDVWSYSLATKRWTLRVPNGAGMNKPVPRYMPGVVTASLDGEETMMIFGGESLPGSTKRSSMNDVWAFHPKSGEWKELSPSHCKWTPHDESASGEDGPGMGIFVSILSIGFGLLLFGFGRALLSRRRVAAAELHEGRCDYKRFPET